MTTTSKNVKGFSHEDSSFNPEKIKYNLHHSRLSSSPLLSSLTPAPPPPFLRFFPLLSYLAIKIKIASLVLAYEAPGWRTQGHEINGSNRYTVEHRGQVTTRPR